MLGVKTAVSLPKTHGRKRGASPPHLRPLVFGREADYLIPKIDGFRSRLFNKSDFLDLWELTLAQ
jgi:hypothetical protein